MTISSAQAIAIAKNTLAAASAYAWRTASVAACLALPPPGSCPARMWPEVTVAASSEARARVIPKPPSLR